MEPFILQACGPGVPQVGAGAPEDVVPLRLLPGLRYAVGLKIAVTIAAAAEAVAVLVVLVLGGLLGG